MDTKIILKRLGFDEVHTGGGCTALQKCFSDGTSILITNNGGATIEDMDDGLIVGFENADGEAELQVIVENPKDIIKLVEEENRFTKGLDMILSSKFRVYNFKNYDITPDLGERGSDRSGWTGSLWRLGRTAHVARIDNNGTVHGTSFDWMKETVRNDGKEDFEKFCASLPPYTNRERIEHYSGVPSEDERDCTHEYIFSEEKVVDILATIEDQIQKGDK